VKLVDRGDRAQAVGEVMTVIAGETVATFVVLSNTVPGITAIAGNAAAVPTASTASVPAIVGGFDVSGEFLACKTQRFAIRTRGRPR
jgi:hypothetical protein